MQVELGYGTVMSGSRRYEPGEALAPAALPDLRLDVASIIPARSRS
jgi:hypothetical protein